VFGDQVEVTCDGSNQILSEEEGFKIKQWEGVMLRVQGSLSAIQRGNDVTERK
jgi:hypothetical protein